jgi:hypothetical protein
VWGSATPPREIKFSALHYMSNAGNEAIDLLVKAKEEKERENVKKERKPRLSEIFSTPKKSKAKKRSSKP